MEYFFCNPILFPALDPLVFAIGFAKSYNLEKTRHHMKVMEARESRKPTWGNCVPSSYLGGMHEEWRKQAKKASGHTPHVWKSHEAAESIFHKHDGS